MSHRYEFNPAFIAQVSAQQPFHGRTCGECAWCGQDGHTNLFCRRNAMPVAWPTANACPAFVEKGTTNE